MTEKILKDNAINPFDFCGITTHNAEKISCLSCALAGTFAEKTEVNFNDIIDNDNNKINLNLQ